MAEQRTNLAKLFAACWRDDALKARFLSDPKTVLAEYGMPVPDGMKVKIVENGDSHVHITLPAPPAGHANLSDDELRNAAGGGVYHFDMGAIAACPSLPTCAGLVGDVQDSGSTAAEG